MFSLRNCQIASLAMLSAYFDFRELYDLLQSEDAYLFSEFAQSCLPASPVKLKLFGIYNIHGHFNDQTGALRCVKRPELCLELELSEDRPVFETCEHTGYVRVRNVSELIQDVFLNSQVIYSQVHDFEKPNAASNWQELKEAVKTVVLNLTEHGERQFSCEAATELYIYLLLHMQAAVLPNKKESLEAITNDLKRLCPVSANQLRTSKYLELSKEDEDSSQITIPMQYYTGEQTNSEPLTICGLTNPYGEEIKAIVPGTSLFRDIPPYGCVYVLRKGIEFISFLPRFRLNGEMAQFVQNGLLCNVWQGHTEQIQTTVLQPAVWAQSAEYGTFVIGLDGRLDESASWPETVPNQAIVSVDAFGVDYCMLLSDGTVVSRLQKQEWEQLITINVGLNAAVAVNERRVPVRGDGTVIHGIKAVEVCSYGEHYICLGAQGEIATDTGLHLMDKVYGIAICEKGYVLAMENQIRLVGFELADIKEWEVLGVTELEAFKNKIAYYDTYLQSVKFLEM